MMGIGNTTTMERTASMMVFPTTLGMYGPLKIRAKLSRPHPFAVEHTLKGTEFFKCDHHAAYRPDLE